MQPSRTASPSRIRLAVCGALLVLYTAVVLVITMWPTQPDQSFGAAVERILAFLHRNGLPDWFSITHLEFTANIAMFVPLGFLLALTLPHRVSWLAVLLVPAFSAAIELTQGQYLPQRFATVSDVIANTIGGYLGAVLAAGVRAVVHERDRLVVARALEAASVR